MADVPRQRIVAARKAVAIGAAELQVATEVSIALGDPIARVRRVAVNRHGDLITGATGIHRGDMMKIEVKLRWREARRAAPPRRLSL